MGFCITSDFDQDETREIENLAKTATQNNYCYCLVR